MENEVLNQEQDMTTNFSNESVEEDDDLFGDWNPTESDIPAQEEDENQNVDDGNKSEENTDTAPQVASSQEQPAFMTIKYNKESKNLTQEEAITLAQKGMNYDEIYGRYESLKANEGFVNELGRLAQANGMSVADYIKNLSDVQEQFEFNKEVETLREKYPNSEDEVLQELARTHLANNANVVSKKQEQEENAKKEQINKQIEIFSKRHPNIDPAKLDMGVYALMREGYTLLEAFETFNADKIDAEASKRESLAKIEKQNMENKKKSLGNLSNSGYNGDDDFIKELFSD